jgi:hypothetical protein
MKSLNLSRGNSVKHQFDIIDENLEEDDEADEPKMPLDWKSRTVAVSGKKHTNILIKFNSTYIIL